MPKCNNCGKVVGSNDLENGVCYSCRNNIPSNTTNNKIITTDKQYKTTITIAKFISFIGLLLVIGGVAIVISAISQSSRYGGFAIMAFAPALGVIITGLITVLFAQTSRAIVDNANSTKQMLDIMQKQQ
jgi:Na+/melibiose symporter-like transporter